jgi:hypothetical protein
MPSIDSPSCYVSVQSSQPVQITNRLRGTRSSLMLQQLFSWSRNPLLFGIPYPDLTQSQVHCHKARLSSDHHMCWFPTTVTELTLVNQQFKFFTVWHFQLSSSTSSFKFHSVTKYVNGGHTDVNYCVLFHIVTETVFTPTKHNVAPYLLRIPAIICLACTGDTNILQGANINRTKLNSWPILDIVQFLVSGMQLFPSYLSALLSTTIITESRIVYADVCRQ